MDNLPKSSQTIAVKEPNLLNELMLCRCRCTDTSAKNLHRDTILLLYPVVSGLLRQ